MKKVLAMMMCLFLLSACGFSGDSHTEPMVTEGDLTTAVTEPDTGETTQKLVSFHAYRGNENADGLLSREVLVPEITPDIVLRALMEDGVVPADVSVLTLTRKEEQLLIDFNNAFFLHLCSMGTAGETMIMNSVVNTFLSAYNATSVIITVEGQTLETGHVIYDFPLTYQE